MRTLILKISKAVDTAAPKNKLEHLSEEIIDFEKDTRILLNDYYAELIDKTEKNEETANYMTT